jgi:hypothetical protein
VSYEFDVGVKSRVDEKGNARDYMFDRLTSSVPPLHYQLWSSRFLMWNVESGDGDLTPLQHLRLQVLQSQHLLLQDTLLLDNLAPQLLL